MRSSRTSEREPDGSFAAFYRQTFLPEHTDARNVALHVLGVLGGLAFVPFVLMSRAPWLVLLYPVVHAAPGLLGHRLFERNAAVGDLRVTRTDHPTWCFLVANHRLTLELLTGRLRRSGPGL